MKGLKFFGLIFIPLIIYPWSDPVVISDGSHANSNPETCKELNLTRLGTGVVWQKQEGSVHNILVRFFDNNGNWWNIIHITQDTASDNTKPVIAYSYRTGKYWVAFQKRTNNNWHIYLTQGDTAGFSLPYSITDTLYLNMNPSLAVIGDTVWVVWEALQENGYHKIHSRFYTQNTWSRLLVVPDSIGRGAPFEPKVAGRYFTSNFQRPLTVFKKMDRGLSHIHYSEFRNGLWQMNTPVCTTSGNNLSPEIVNFGFWGSAFLWFNELGRDIWMTGIDTFATCHPITSDTIFDRYPSGMGYYIPTENILSYCLVWNRGQKIYSKFSHLPSFVPVETNAVSSKPVITGSFGRGGVYLWCLYEKDNEIIGRREVYSGIKEKPSAVRIIQRGDELKKLKGIFYDALGRRREKILASGLYFIKPDPLPASRAAEGLKLVLIQK